MITVEVRHTAAGTATYAVLHLKHTNGEERKFDIVGQQAYQLTIRWGVGGMYNIDVRNGYITKAPSWRAVDLDSVMKYWRTKRP